MRHVLLVEADKTIRDQTVLACQGAGLSVSTSSNAQTAIGACEDHKPDVIVLELQLRGHSGIEFLHELRSYPEWQDIPVVLHTLVPWADLEKFKDAFKSMGIVGYAYKPETSFRKLIGLLEDTLSITK